MMTKEERQGEQNVEVLGLSKFPFFSSGVSEGFQSRPEVSEGFQTHHNDTTDTLIDLNKELVKNPASTYYVKVTGNSLIDTGIYDGDLLIVDRAMEPNINDIALCVINREVSVKRISKVNGSIYLLPTNADYKPIKITENNNFEVLGIVLYIVHKTR